ncbi:MAG: hypothetical protein H7124_08695, partial [Phycisphaerales bacterium]|nr:hypothetical protein [Hyphomonadaceae bacterium]
SARPALGACVVVILLGLGVYLAIGRPELPGAAYAQRLETLIVALNSPTPPPITQDEHLAVWLHFARENPQDVTPLLGAGDAWLSLGRAREASLEFDRALRLDPQSSEALLGMGRALVALEGRVTPEAEAYFAQAAARTDDPTPWIYQAMAAMEQDREADARRFWGEALTRMPADDPRRDMARSMSQGE